jgi:hypothetical protein
LDSRPGGNIHSRIAAGYGLVVDVDMGDGVGHYPDGSSDVSGQLDEPYAPAILSLLPVPVVRAAATIVGMTFLVVLLIAIHPWTFVSTPSSSPSFQVGNLIGTGGTSTNSNPGGNFTPVDTSTEPPSASAADPSAEAAAVTTILDQMKADRAAVVAAVNDAAACGGNLAGDVQALQNSQSDRTNLARSASRLTVDVLGGASSVPQELNTALTDSATADGDFAAWAMDLTQSCTAGTATQDQNYQAGQQASKTAQQDKQNFLDTWNPIAQQYGQEILTASDI